MPRPQSTPRGGVAGKVGAQKLATRAEAVVALGLSGPRVLDRMLAKGAPRPKAGKRGAAKYDVEAIRRWRDERRAKQAPTLDLQSERARLARAQRHLANLKIKQLRGVLVPRDAVRLLDSQRQASVRAAALRMPSEAVQRGLPPEHEGLIRELVEDMLSGLSKLTWSEVGQSAA